MPQSIPDEWIRKVVRFPVHGAPVWASGTLINKNEQGIRILFRTVISGPRVSYDGGITWTSEGGNHYGPWQEGFYYWDEIGEVELSPSTSDG